MHDSHQCYLNFKWRSCKRIYKLILVCRLCFRFSLTYAMIIWSVILYRVLCLFNVYFLLTINVRRTIYLRIYLPTFFVNVFFSDFARGYWKFWQMSSHMKFKIFATFVFHPTFRRTIVGSRGDFRCVTHMHSLQTTRKTQTPIKWCKKTFEHASELWSDTKAL